MSWLDELLLGFNNFVNEKYEGCMDPISAMLAVFLDGTSGVVSNHFKSSLNTDVQAVVVDYDDQRVSFEHQMWRIRDGSVCADKKGRVDEYSSCTLGAKELFVETCRYLQSNPRVGARYDSVKNMYCSAAISFKPTIAFISSAGHATPLEEAKRECNRLILNRSSTEVERNRACSRYEELERLQK
ncbi:hypothetical protein [uncultured Halomonas sp.]|uniref:hypothetical protein n=1 Tax=uncultured Halomonas sp. TaxID=173971 RepID=UPI00260CDECD|nr:hypothetical protein [uncultured Halomonas sp.]